MNAAFFTIENLQAPPSQPYADPLDVALPPPSPARFLYELENLIHPHLTATATFHPSGPRFQADFQHRNRADADDFVERLAQSIDQQNPRIHFKPSPHGWQLLTLTPTGPNPLATLHTDDTSISFTNPPTTADQPRIEPATWKPPAPTEDFHTLVFLAPPDETPTPWWPPDHWILYTNLRQNELIRHTATIGTFSTEQPLHDSTERPR